MSSTFAAAAPRQAPKLRWTLRLLNATTAYLPIVLMGLLALGTWWLVKNTPLLDTAQIEAPPRHEPDYTMTQFKVQRFSPDGALRVQIEGDVLRHYPDTDTIEVDNPRIRSIGPDGAVMIATAKQALANGDGSEVQLSGQARVLREATPNQEAIEFRGEFLHAFLRTERVRSHLPVVVTQGRSELRAEGMAYDNLARVVELKGRMRGVFVEPASKPR